MSNLTVSYVSQTPADKPAGPKAAAPAADSPLGFLAALLDQLGGGSKASATTGASAVDVTGLLAALTSQTATTADTAGADDLAAALATPQTSDADPASGAADPDALTIANLIRSLLGDKPAETDDADATKATATAPQVQDNLLQVLTTLGLAAPSVAAAAPATSPETASASATARVAGVTTIPAPLLRLSAQLSQVATDLAGKSPDLAKKIEAVATRLVSGDAGTDLLGKLTDAASQSDGTALDTLVRNLIEAKPVSAPAPSVPQIAAATLPAPVALKQSKSAVAEVKAAPPEPASATADSAPKSTPGVTLTAVAHDPASDADPKPDAKVAAAAADAAKADAAAQPAQAQPQPAPAAAQPARALPAAYQTATNPINMGQVAFEMMRQVHQGTSRFTIRLDPPEMGRVDVRMHVDATGAVNARLTVDRAETLDLFQRDRQSLERALAQAGLDGAKTNLEFSLRQQNNPFAGMMGGDQRQQSGYGGASRLAATDTDTAAIPAITLYRGTASAGGVNIFA